MYLENNCKHLINKSNSIYTPIPTNIIHFPIHYAKLGHKINKWYLGEFNNLPSVYAFCDGNKILYIGSTINISYRLSSHYYFHNSIQNIKTTKNFLALEFHSRGGLDGLEFKILYIGKDYYKDFLQQNIQYTNF